MFKIFKGINLLFCLNSLSLVQPDECLDDRRRMSKTTMDMCQDYFEELEYTEEYLAECGLIQGGD